VINTDWLTGMAEHIQRPEVGAVGAKLLFPGDTVQHAGVLLEENGPPRHAFIYAPAKTMENGARLQLVSNYSAVTAACMLTRRDVFEQVGGFDEIHLPVALNDVDYCLKVRQAGYQIVYTPFARLYHYESATRGHGKNDPAEGRLLRERWRDALAHDPFNNPNLSWDAGRYQASTPQGAQK
jgi:GT2 family glycosyltransferase